MLEVLRRLPGGSSGPGRARARVIGFLHTADAHVETFRELVTRVAPELQGVHRLAVEAAAGLCGGAHAGGAV